LLVLALALPLAAQQHDMANMPGMPEPEPQQASADMQMDHHHMDMGPHMKMTELRPANAADQQRANDIVVQMRSVIGKYNDVKVAEADGFKMFAPQIKHQHQYHFTNYRYAAEAAFHFNPERPTSLLYQDDGHGGMKLIGAMFTAPKNATPDELDARVPLSVAQWHAHVNLCVPPRDQRADMLSPHARFGLRGSIATREECVDAGGMFFPQVFGWMVHVYPWESDPKQVWSVEKQMHHDD
jgi:hypothetical protein